MTAHTKNVITLLERISCHFYGPLVFIFVLNKLSNFCNRKVKSKANKKKKIKGNDEIYTSNKELFLFCFFYLVFLSIYLSWNSSLVQSISLSFQFNHTFSPFLSINYFFFILFLSRAYFHLFALSSTFCFFLSLSLSIQFFFSLLFLFPSSAIYIHFLFCSKSFCFSVLFFKIFL